MTAYNIVRMQVKPGREQDFIQESRSFEGETHDRLKKNGLRRMSLVKTGDRSYCFIGEWENMDSVARSRPEMIANLDQLRDMLEDLGGENGVTDPVSGETVIELR